MLCLLLLALFAVVACDAFTTITLQNGEVLGCFYGSPIGCVGANEETTASLDVCASDICGDTINCAFYFSQHQTACGHAYSCQYLPSTTQNDCTGGTSPLGFYYVISGAQDR